MYCYRYYDFRRASILIWDRLQPHLTLLVSYFETVRVLPSSNGYRMDYHIGLVVASRWFFTVWMFHQSVSFPLYIMLCQTHEFDAEMRSWCQSDSRSIPFHRCVPLSSGPLSGLQWEPGYSWDRSECTLSFCPLWWMLLLSVLQPPLFCVFYNWMCAATRDSKSEQTQVIRTSFLVAW